MKCFYEILEINQECSYEEIKYAYRRLALKWHPDKNNDDGAIKEFQWIQKAYSVLSNPSEREFYDRNKDNILRDDVNDASVDITDVILSHFSSSCFKGFDDTNHGFFTVYRQAFTTIAKIESSFMTNFQSQIPSFGRSDTFTKEVAIFYNYWMNYTTGMKFEWVDQHTIDSINGRRTERIMVRENKKLREIARKKFVNYVRSFVQLVKKKDIRMKAYEKEQHEEIERKKEETSHKQEEIRRRRIQRKQDLHQKEAANVQPDELYEKQLKILEEQCDKSFPILSSGEEEEADKSSPSELCCIVCDKAFKTGNAFVNHEKSKKHIEKLEILKESMTKADASLFNMSKKSPEEESQLNEAPVLEDANVSKRGTFKEESILIDLSEKPLLKELSTLDKELILLEQIKKLQKRKKKDKKTTAIVNDVDLLSDEDERTQLCEELNHIQLDPLNEIKQREEESINKIKEKKLRRRKKNNEKVVQIEVNQCCVCAKIFPTKNKLFKHIKTEGHAVLK